MRKSSKPRYKVDPYASILPGYEYNIFISYCHNDNLPSYDYGRQSRSDRVIEFVKNLQGRFAATIKEPVMRSGNLEWFILRKTRYMMANAMILLVRGVHEENEFSEIET